MLSLLFDWRRAEHIKKPQAPRGTPAALNSRIYIRLIFNNDALDHTSVASARVIHAHFLAGPQRGGHDFTGRVHNVRGRAESEADWSFAAPDHNGLARR